MSNTSFIIKKSKFSKKLVPIYGGMVLPIGYIVLGLLMFFSIYLDYDKEENGDDFILIFMVIFLLFAVYGVYLLVRIIRSKRLKKFKYNGLGIVKKAKVTFIGKLKFNNGRGYNVDVYYLEAEDLGMIYYSNGYTKGTLGGTSIADLQLLYAKYGFHFDENQNKKDEVLRNIDELISEKEYEKENSGFISKIVKKRKIGYLMKDRRIVSEGYIPSYWEVGGNKVSVGDMVDVYCNPDNPDRYWVDIDFLFGK